ncbi:MAG TPA: DUF3300 domain-containing protein [Opitutaceae bacterium]|nr:DUF3300 domain-containing protein [Opitutaceae bacterium]
MHPRLFPLAALALIFGAQASGQIFRPLTAAAPAPVQENPPAASENTAPAAELRLTAEQLDQLLGPIALYPDALIALILPAATAPSDIVLAGRYLSDNPSGLDEVENQSWDDSVKALAHYPEVVKWMDQNLAWTKQVGEAFVQQPAEVMKSMQRLRAAARAAGTLVDTPQQQVIAEAETIYIVPAQRDVIYVPSYDPDIVYLPRRNYYSGSFFSFSIGYPVGYWLGYHVDWRDCRLWTIDRRSRQHYWHAQPDWRRPTFYGGLSWRQDSTHRHWSPNPVYSRPVHRQQSHYTAEIARPSRNVRDHRSFPSQENRGGRVDRASENRTASPSPRTHQTHQTHQRSAASWTNSFEPKVVAPQVQAPKVSIPTAPIGSPRENRGSRTNDQRAHENRARPEGSRGFNRGSVVAAPAPSPSASPAPAQASPPAPARNHSASRGDRQPQAVPVAAAPRSESSSESRESSRSSSSNGNRGHRSHSASGRN